MLTLLTLVRGCLVLSPFEQPPFLIQEVEFWSGVHFPAGSRLRRGSVVNGMWNQTLPAVEIPGDRLEPFLAQKCFKARRSGKGGDLSETEPTHEFLKVPLETYLVAGGGSIYAPGGSTTALIDLRDRRRPIVFLTWFHD